MCGLCTVYHGLFALPIGVIGRLCYVIVVLPGHLYYFEFDVTAISVAKIETVPIFSQKLLSTNILHESWH